MAEQATQVRDTPAPASAPAPESAQPAPAPPPAAPAPKGAAGSVAGSFIVVRDRYTIYCDRPIPSLDMPNALAFEVTDRKQEGRPLYALVVKPEMPPRISVMRILKGLEIPTVLHMVDWGVAEWPPADRKCGIVIYHRPMGGRVMDSMAANFKRIPDHMFARAVIKPIADALIELAQKGIAHRAIRPDNLYYLDEQRTKIALGDCVTSVPAHDQPVVVETIESGMAMPSARGAGHYTDDMYAFGATVLILAIGRNPVQGMSDADIIQKKIDTGSYAALLGEERVPVAMIECLRGLLTDDAEQRWKAENIDLWMNGKRLTPIQAKAEEQAQRALRFMDQEYHSVRPLSFAMYRNWEKAIGIITDGSLEIWLRRGLESNDLADAVAGAIKNSGAMPGANKGDADDLLLARVLMILDPEAPVRFREFRVHIEGFGAALAIAMMRKHKVQPYVDFINRELWRYWIAAQTRFNPDNQQFEQVFRDLKNYLKDANSGAGIERCVYELNEWQFCMSPLIEAQFVMEVKGVLPALDLTSKAVNTKMWPVDRHIAAFLRARYAKGCGTQIDAMNDPRPDRATIGMLSVLAIVQWRLGPEAVYGLSSWVGGLMGPVISSYQSRPKRKDLERELPKMVRKGNLAEMYNFLDNPEERQKDAEGFSWAKAEYAAAEKLIYDLEHGQVDRQDSAIKLGRQSGAVGAVVIMFITYTVAILVHLL